MLGEYYSPAKINTLTRTISTSWCPAYTGSFEDIYQKPRVTLPQTITAFKDGPWTIRFRSPMNDLCTHSTKEIVGAVFKMKMSGIDSLNWPGTFFPTNRVFLNSDGREAYAFILDRLYRLNHQLALPIGYHVAKNCIYAAGRIAISLAILYGSYQIDMMMKTRGLSVLATISRLCLLSTIGFVSLRQFYRGSNQLIGNMFFVPVNHQRLDLWAQQIRRLESQEQASISVEQRQNRGGEVLW